jgi:SAM-dependent methyltransferase
MRQESTTEQITETPLPVSHSEEELNSRVAPSASRRVRASERTIRGTRFPWRWSDLWQAPVHDFPVRDHILYQSVRIRPESRVCEIGSGSGFTAFCLARTVRQLTLLDVSEESVRDLRAKLGHFSNVDFIQGDAARVSFAEENRFDLVFGLDVFEYVKDARGCLENLATTLLPGGQLFLTYPNDSPEIGDGVNYFARLEDLEKLLSYAGFRSWHIYAVRPTRYAALMYGLLHELPLKLYRKLRRTRVQDLPQTYEATWAFVYGRKVERYKFVLHSYWAILAGLLWLGGDFFVAEPVNGSDIVGKQLVIEAWK